MEKKYLIFTYGCQMNVRDSETIAGILESLGYSPTEREEEADLILFNTCSVRENPERKIYGKVTQLRMLKEENPGLLIGICGCMPQQEIEQKRIREKHPEVDLVFGTHNIARLPELLASAKDGRTIEVWSEGKDHEGLPAHRQDDLKAFVNIMYGCNNFCSYCIVPYTRGRERSREPEAILDEVQRLVASGYKEITLLGQNVNSYGKGLTRKIDFAELLSLVDGIEGIERIRFTTSHPKDVSDRLIEAMATLPKVCEHLHLPLQAGSDRILSAMKRGYTSSQYLKLVDKLRERIPSLALSTDLIVGFPTESEEDFAETLEMVEKVGWDSAFMFAYSPRVGTRAAAMAEQVDEDVKKRRLNQLIQLQNKISHKVSREYLGRTCEILIEGASPKDQRELTGRTRTNKTVIFPLPEGEADLWRGRLVPVRITRTFTWTLHGVLEEETDEKTVSQGDQRSGYPGDGSLQQ
jgi:tRNA-2-methylthio-N6-dimethylallyladenosine synthase